MTKRVLFHACALDEFRELPKQVRKAFGEMLRHLQEGVSIGMPDSRPMPIVAMGVDELRARERIWPVSSVLFEEVESGYPGVVRLPQEISGNADIRNMHCSEEIAGVA